MRICQIKMFNILKFVVIIYLLYPAHTLYAYNHKGLLRRNPDSHQQTQPLQSSKKFRLSERKCMQYISEIEGRVKELKRLRNRTDMQAITYGEDAMPGQYPNMGAIGWLSSELKWRFLCGSSLISERFVITAAHCTHADLPELAKEKPSIVRFGVTDLENTDNNIPTVDVGIESMTTAPDYVWPYKYYDIAVFKLNKTLKFNKFLQPACLWGTPNLHKIKSKISIVGFGRTEDDSITNTKLKHGTVSIIKTSQCKKLLEPYCNRYWCNVEDHQMCAGVLNGGVDTCVGDSGGPLLYRLLRTNEGIMNVVVGVTSFGMTTNECGLRLTPGIYTKVSSFIDWIESIVWPGEQ